MEIKIKPWTRFGRLITTGETKSVKVKGWWTKVYERCVCDCWNERWVTRSGLRCWTKSCWCLQKETASKRNSTHRLTKTGIYRTYSWIQTRCYNPNDKCYHNYGWRWIKCLRNSFEQFYEEMWASYYEHVAKYWKSNTTIDRIDVNGDYCKENCRRATKKEQGNNQRTNTICIIDWVQHNLWEWSKILWIPRETLKRHIIKWKIKGQIFNRWTWEMYKYREFGWN